jgi:alpha-tubulin suppressor-like RCC1 family protein
MPSMTGIGGFIRKDRTVLLTGDSTSSAMDVGKLENVGFSFSRNITNVRKMVTTAYATYAIGYDDTLNASGDNSKGQLGLGNSGGLATFGQIATDVRDIKALTNNTFILKTDGSLWATGLNTHGQLGLGHTDEVRTFTKVDDNVAEVFSDGNSTFILKSSGLCYAVGYNQSGKLGIGADVNATVTELTLVMDGVKEVNIHGEDVVLLKTDGKMYTAGRNVYGSIGRGSSEYVTTFGHVGNNVVEYQYNNWGIGFLTSEGYMYFAGQDSSNRMYSGSTSTTHRYSFHRAYTGIKQFLLNNNNIYVLHENGTLLACGHNGYGQFGNGNTTSLQSFTTCRGGVKRIIGVNDYRTVFIELNDGSVMSAGYNNYGQAGVGNTDNIQVWTEIPELSNTDDPIIYFNAPSTSNTTAITESGNLYIFGYGVYGNIGNGTENDSTRPFLAMTNVKRIFTYGSYTHYVITNDNEFYSWGYNTECRTGHFEQDWKSIPRPKKLSDNIADFDMSGATIIALSVDGRIGGGGQNLYSQLGIGGVPRFNPNFMVGNTRDIKRLYVGESNTAYINKDGRLFVRGRASIHGFGLRDGTQNTNEWVETLTTPTNGIRIAQVAFGSGVIYAMRDNGYVYAIGSSSNWKNGTNSNTDTWNQRWSGMKAIQAGLHYIAMHHTNGWLYFIGYNSHGEWGNGTTTSSSNSNTYNTINIGSDGDYDCGYYHTVAVKSDGTLWVTGRNSEGQLGLGHTSNQSDWTQVMTDVKKVACGNYATYILTKDGTLMACGRNISGEMGVGSDSDKITTPAIVANDVVDLFSGPDFCYFQKVDGSIWGFGRNNEGQLGLGDFNNRKKPTLIANSARMLFSNKKPYYPTDVSITNTPGGAVTGGSVYPLFYNINTNLLDLPYRKQIKVKDNGNIIDPWSENYLTEESLQSSFDVPGLQLDRTKESSIIEVIAEDEDGYTFTATYSLKLLNEAPNIKIAVSGHNLNLQITDVEGDRVQYLIKLGDTPIFPQTGNLSSLQYTPVDLNLILPRDKVVIGQMNTITVTARDERGQEKTVPYNFIGDYAGIMFTDEAGEYYSTDVGEILQYLDMGTIIAGQTSISAPVLLLNKNSFKITNIILSRDKGSLPEGVDVQLSKSDNPFEGADALSYEDTITLKSNETLTFYVRITSSLTADPGNGEFKVKVKADPTE